MQEYERHACIVVPEALDLGGIMTGGAVMREHLAGLPPGDEGTGDIANADEFHAPHGRD
jgi:hypothetical protein